MTKVKFLAIIAIALTSVFAFTSCDKDNDETDPKKESETKESFFYVPGGGEQLKYIDATFTLKVDGKTVNVKMSDMTEVKDISSIHDMDSWKKTVESSIGNPTLKVYSYSLGKIKEAQFVSSLFAKIAQPDHNIDIIKGHMLNVNGKTNYSSCAVFTDVEDIQGLIDTMNDRNNQ